MKLQILNSKSLQISALLNPADDDECTEFYQKKNSEEVLTEILDMELEGNSDAKRVEERRIV